MSLVWEYVEEADIDFSKLYAAGPAPATFSTTKASFQTTLNLFKQNQQTRRAVACYDCGWWCASGLQESYRLVFRAWKSVGSVPPTSLCTRFNHTLTPRHNMTYCYKWSTCKSLRNCRKTSPGLLLDQLNSIKILIKRMKFLKRT